MAVKLSPFGPKPQFMLATGLPAVGGLLFFYVAGSVGTKQNTYTDSGGLSANTNPIVLNSLGEPTTQIWFTAGQTYKAVLAPSTDTDPPTSPVWTVDNLTGINDTTVAGQDEWVASGITPTYVGATSFTMPGDQTTTLHVGRRIKSTVTAGTSYGTITGAAFAALTTITVDTTGSNPLDSGLTAVSYGLLRADNFTQSAGMDVVARQGSDIVAAATLNLDAAGGDLIDVTGATGITAITLGRGKVRTVRFTGAPLITNGASLVLPGAANVQAVAGDIAVFRGYAAGVVRCVSYSRVTGGSVRGGWDLLATSVAAASATIDFTSGITSLYDEYVLTVTDMVPATDATALNFRISEDAGATFKAGVTDYAYTQISGTDGGAPAGSGSTGTTSLQIASNLSNAKPFSGEVRIFGPAGTSRVKVIEAFAGYGPSGLTVRSIKTSGFYVGDAGAINGFRFLMSAGNITAGNFALYGVRKT